MSHTSNKTRTGQARNVVESVVIAVGLTAASYLIGGWAGWITLSTINFDPPSFSFCFYLIFMHVSVRKGASYKLSNRRYIIGGLRTPFFTKRSACKRRS